MKTLIIGARPVPGRSFVLPVLLALLLIFPASLHSQTLHVLSTNGPVGKRLNLVVLAEGYTSNQVGQFLSDATNLVQGLLASEPFASYRGGLNAYAISVPSLESGSDHPGQGTWRNTWFNSSFDSYGVSEYLTIPPNDFDADPQHGLGRVETLLNALLPQWDLPILLVNDPLYGASGGGVVVCSRFTGISDTVLHESGHTLAGLGDEYEDALPGFPDVEEPNTTRTTQRDQVKWKAWLEAATPVPTPATAAYASMVGLFEGAHYHTTGWFRPRLNCRMRDAAYPFCEVCQEALVCRFYQKLRPVDAFLPVSTNLVFTVPGTWTFAVTPLPSPAGDVRYAWSWNGAPLAGQTNAGFTVPAGLATNGQHRLRVDVRDATARVRSDPEGRLQQSVEWQLQVNLPWLKLRPLAAVAGIVSLSVTGVAPAGLVMESSTNWSSWQPISTNQLTNGSLTVNYPAAPASVSRFYRARALP